MKIKILLPILALVVACSSLFEPSTENMIGFYEVVALNGQELPVIAPTGVVSAGSMTLDVTGHYIIRLEICPNDFLCLYGAISKGLYRVDGNTLLLEQYDSNNKFVEENIGQIMNKDLITVEVSNVELVFVRST